MNKLKEFLREQYDEDKVGMVRFVNRTCRLVKITRHWWRGYKKMNDGTVTVGGTSVNEAAATKPSWKLLPDKVKLEFSVFERAVDAAIRDMCVSGQKGSDDEQPPLVFGDGVYAIDTALWPEAESVLGAVRAKWGEAADKWCTDDGYQEFKNLIKEQIGEVDYARVENLIPAASILRGKFWLEFYPLAFRLTEDVGGPSEEAGRREATVELIEAAVREPREQAASAWRGLAAQMVTVGSDGTVKAKRPERTGKNGAITQGNRTVRGDSVAVARRGYENLTRTTRFHDYKTTHVLGVLATELPDDEPSQKRLAVSLNGDDNASEQLSSKLLTAADVVSDVNNMIAGVVAATSRVES